jgi:hypothetical protein
VLRDGGFAEVSLVGIADGRSSDTFSSAGLPGLFIQSLDMQVIPALSSYFRRIAFCLSNKSRAK